MKFLNSKFKILNSQRKGAVLLVVLFIIMAITILSLGFLSRSDVELACGQNMILHTQMDYLAESGLEHAKGLMLNPQEIEQEYWTGAAGQQLVESSSDYYDVRIVRDENELNNYCNYNIECDAYRLKSGEKIGRSSFKAELRLDPCIALSVGQSTTLWSTITINGDVNCVGTLTNQGNIYGDVFADDLSGTVMYPNQKKSRQVLQNLSFSCPDINPDDFISKTKYYYPSGHTLDGDDQIVDSVLLVKGNLTVSGSNNVIVAGKNLPALYVTGDLIIEKGASLNVTGLAVVGNDLRIGDNTNFVVSGGLFVYRGIIQVQTASDESGNGNTATLYNTPIWRTAEHMGGALQFDGTDDYAQTADSTTKLQLTGDYTISVWIKPYTSQNIWAGIVSKTDPTGTNNHWTLQFDNATPRKLIIYHPSASWYTGITINDLIAGGTWHHIAVVRSGSTMKSYLNGTAKATGSLGNPGYGNGHLNIGADRTASSSYVYGGLIDDVRIYNRALIASEVSSPPNDPNLIGYWKFDEANPSLTITVAPTKTAVLLGSQGSQHWGQAAGAFFRSIKRQ